MTIIIKYYIAKTVWICGGKIRHPNGLYTERWNWIGRWLDEYYENLDSPNCVKSPK